MDVMQTAELWGNHILIWIGFGTLVGLMAKAVMPGRDPGGTVTTLLVGICGCVIGCGVLAFLTNGIKVSPISPVGFVVATAGAFILLLFYKLLAGHFFLEAEDVRTRVKPKARRRITLFQDE